MLTVCIAFKVERSTSPSGLSQDEQSHGIHKNDQDMSRDSKGNLVSISTLTI